MKRYYYFDNWNGSKHEFDNIQEAKKSANGETGNYIVIWDSVTNKSISVNSTGFCPA